ncbi:sulfotransferase [Aquihabitans sp. McL0605]|uniref:sulfotransferase n=1 Tax=Aquihabitans sp. McL0605 TaxID=3415671 RepID=UPI003CFA817F
MTTSPATTGGRAAGGRTLDTTDAPLLTKVRRSRAGTALTDAGKATLRAYGVATAGRRRGPELVVVGAKRGGTTSLWKYLDSHPGILPTFPRAEQIKGTYFFDEEWAHGERWYRSHFPTDRTRARAAMELGYEPIAFEASPYYLFHPHAPARAHQTVPDALIVALLRDPVERAFSHYKERRNHTEPLAFADAIAAEADRTAGEEERMLADPSVISMAHRHQTYVAQSRYAPMLERWIGAFGPDQVLVAPAEEFYADPQELCDQITDRVHLPRHDLGRPEPFNSEPSADMDDEVRTALRASLKDDIEAVEQLLGRPMPWPR